MKKEDTHGDFTPVVKLELRRVDPEELVRHDEVLRASAFLRALGDASAGVLKLGIARRFPDKVAVFRQGESGDSLFLVLKGEARLFARADKDVVELGNAHKGDVFGEDEIVGAGAERSTSAVAAGELDVLELPKKALGDCAKKQPALKACLREVQEQRVKAKDEMAAFLNRW